jgi:PhzF family phenazine biosynthesis protein
MHRFQQIDVFSPRPLGGNPVAVVHGAEGLTTEQMLEFTRWTNLSEATFLLPPTHPEADYRVRIFTLVGELDFAGHPTLGTCHAWLSAGGRPRREGVVVQECPAGLIRIRQLDDGLAFEAPPLTRQGPVSEDHLARVAGILRIPVTDIVDAAWVDNGPGWVGIMLESADAVVALRPLSDNGSQIDIGIVGLYPPGGTYAYEMRALFTDDSGGLREDPVTGSLNASVAQWLLGSGLVKAPYVASQGTAIGRTGRPRISQDDDGAVWVGGDTHTIIEGTVALD